MACVESASIAGMGIGSSGKGNGISYGYPDCVYGAMYAKNESQFWVKFSNPMVLCNGNPFSVKAKTLSPLFPDCISIRHDHALNGVNVSATIMWTNATHIIACNEFKATPFGGVYTRCVGGIDANLLVLTVPVVRDGATNRSSS